MVLMRAKNDTGTSTVSYDNSNDNNFNGLARTHTVPIPLSYSCKRERKKERERENELIIDYCHRYSAAVLDCTTLVIAHHTGNYPILHMLTCIHGWTANPSRLIFSYYMTLRSRD